MHSQRPAGIAIKVPDPPSPVASDAHYWTALGRAWKDAVADPCGAAVAKGVKAVAPENRIDSRRLSESPGALPPMRCAQKSGMFIVRPIAPDHRFGKIPVQIRNRVGRLLDRPDAHKRPLVVIADPNLTFAGRLHVLDPIAKDEFTDRRTLEVHHPRVRFAASISCYQQHLFRAPWLYDPSLSSLSYRN